MARQQPALASIDVAIIDTTVLTTYFFIMFSRAGLATSFSHTENRKMYKYWSNLINGASFYFETLFDFESKTNEANKLRGNIIGLNREV